MHSDQLTMTYYQKTGPVAHKNPVQQTSNNFHLTPVQAVNN